MMPDFGDDLSDQELFEPWTCPKCGVLCTDSDAKILHRCRTVDQLHKCDECGTSYTTDKGLRRHINNYHQRKLLEEDKRELLVRWDVVMDQIGPWLNQKNRIQPKNAINKFKKKLDEVLQ
jgi:predicted RNA-binding Zn-ribbon protein involved in translation (DUF1610 family)